MIDPEEILRLPAPWRTHTARRAINTTKTEFRVFFHVLHDTGLRTPAISALAMHCRREAFLEAQCILALFAQKRWSEYFSRCDAALDALRRGT